MVWDANPNQLTEVLLGGATDPPDQALIVLQGLLGLQDGRNSWLKDGRFLEVYPSVWLVNWVIAEDTFIRKAWAMALVFSTYYMYKIYKIFSL